MIYRIHPIIRRAAGRLAIITLACVGLAGVPTTSAAARTSPAVTLRVAFAPDRPGASTTMTFGFVIRMPTGGIPPALTQLHLQLPEGMGLGTTDLGEALCTPTTLRNYGPQHCPANSFMGLGKALVVDRLADQNVYEKVQIAILMAQAVEEHTTMLFEVEGLSPVYSETLFQGLLLPDSKPYGARLVAQIPIVTVVPEAPPVAILRMRSTLGPSKLTYYRRVSGRRVPYKPEGMAVPAICPRGGYPFEGTFTFVEGSTATARTRVPCPSRARRAPKQHYGASATHTTHPFVGRRARYGQQNGVMQDETRPTVRPLILARKQNL